MRFQPGIYSLNKPKGWTSFDVVKWVRCRSDEKKVGHGGTLDPNATGLLLVAVGKQFTRKIDGLITADKHYQGEMILGRETDSYDIDGQIIKETSDIEVDINQLKEVSRQFIGRIKQTPPMYSAKKVNGRKLYELAREGKEIEREQVDIEINTLEITELIPDKFPRVKFSADVSKGTYIRSLVHDIGKVLGCGAVLSELNRTRIGDYVLHPDFSIDPIKVKEMEQCS